MARARRIGVAVAAVVRLVLVLRMGAVGIFCATTAFAIVVGRARTVLVRIRFSPRAARAKSAKVRQVVGASDHARR
jgi:hypothetical protein